MTSGSIPELLGDPRFFERAGPFTPSAVAQAAGGTLDRPEIAPALLRGVAALETAGPDDVAVLHNPRYSPAAAATRAGLVIVGAKLAARVPAGSAVLVVEDAHLAWAQVARLFHPDTARAAARVHPTAVVDASALVDPGADIGAYAVIGPQVRLAAGCRVGPHAVIGAGVELGPDCRIGAGASLSHALLGARVYVYPGARIGQDGFGFAMTAQGFVSVPQLGRVILQDDVEIGANSTVDRGASHDTVIGAGSRIDNLIQIGHNVQMGRGCVMAAQSGISGSCTLEDYVQIGAQAGLAGHLRVGARARIGAQAGVMSDVPAASDVIGSPALPVREFFRNVAVLRRLARRGPAGGQTDKAAD